MQNETYSLYHLTIDPANYDALKALVDELVAATAKESDTIAYEFLVNADRTKVHIIERYRTQGLLPHVRQTFSPYAERFLALVKIDQLYVYGDTTPEIREVLDGFGAIYLTSFAGFTR